jgi:hypothetical protein
VLAELLTSVVNKMWYRMDDKLKWQLVEFDWSKLVDDKDGFDSLGRDNGGMGGTLSMSGLGSMDAGGVDAANAESVTSSPRNSPRTPPRVRPPSPPLVEDDSSKMDALFSFGSTYNACLSY